MEIKNLTKIKREFDAARLEEIQALTGCPVGMVIEGRCQQENCPNAVVKSMDGREAALYCRRVQEIINEGLVSPADLENTERMERARSAISPAPIIDIRPHTRCVL